MMAALHWNTPYSLGVLDSTGLEYRALCSEGYVCVYIQSGLRESGHNRAEPLYSLKARKDFLCQCEL